MTPYKFATNERPTLGVEIELNLVDSQTMALRSGATQILSEVPAELEGSVKPELFQCYIELNTKVCQNVAEVERDLAGKIQVVDEIAAPPRPASFLGRHSSRFRPGRIRTSRPTSATTA